MIGRFHYECMDYIIYSLTMTPEGYFIIYFAPINNEFEVSGEKLISVK